MQMKGFCRNKYIPFKTETIFMKLSRKFGKTYKGDKL